MNLDLVLVKTFYIREGLRLELRAEAFNIANHPQFGVGSTTVTWGNQGPVAQSLFGVIRQTITPTSMRQIQFALKYNF